MRAVPEKRKGDESDGGEISRLERLEKDGKKPDIPPFDGPRYLLDYFWEVGPTMSAGMGAAPITHGEIESWQRNLGIRLTPWECRTLRRMSIEYLNESQRAAKRDCPSPWNPADTSIEHRIEVANDMMKAIRQMAAE